MAVAIGKEGDVELTTIIQIVLYIAAAGLLFYFIWRVGT
jgi:hypothetical protein